MLAVARTIIATVLCLSLTVAGFAQDAFAPDRIRLRGVRAYEIPGVMAMTPNGVTGSAITVTGSEIHVLRPAPNPVLTVLTSGERLTGRALSVVNGEVTLIPEDRTDPVHIPLDAIARLEISRGRAHSRATAILIGIAAGIGGMFGGGWLGISLCDSLFDCPGAGILAVAAGFGLGGWTGAMLGKERWQTVPIEWLSDPAVRANIAAK